MYAYMLIHYVPKRCYCFETKCHGNSVNLLDHKISDNHINRMKLKTIGVDRSTCMQ